MEGRPRRSNLVLYLIAAFKMVKAAMLFLIGAGVIAVAREGGAGGDLVRWIEALALDPRNRHIEHLLEAVGTASQERLHELGVGALAYATVFLVEGVGLALRRHWAEYLTILVTLSFIPIPGLRAPPETDGAASAVDPGEPRGSHLPRGAPQERASGASVISEAIPSPCAVGSQSRRSANAAPTSSPDDAATSSATATTGRESAAVRAGGWAG